MLESGYCYQRLFLMDLLMPDVSHTDACIEGEFFRAAILLLSSSSYNQIAVYLNSSLNCPC
jgi:hypothetical protein